MSSSNTIAQQNDPCELLEIFDAGGHATGVARSRAQIHLAGHWHQAFHCWIVRSGAQVVLQRRSLAKDTFAGFWDASAAGHWRFGETPEQAARELAEELGLSVPFSALRYVRRESQSRRFANGLVDREHHQVYLLRWDAPLATYQPDPAEVSALAALPIAEFLQLLGRRREASRAAEAVLVGPDPRVTTADLEVRASDLVPYSAARMRRILGSVNLDC